MSELTVRYGKPRPRLAQQVEGKPHLSKFNNVLWGCFSGDGIFFATTASEAYNLWQMSGRWVVAVRKPVVR